MNIRHCHDYRIMVDIFAREDDINLNLHVTDMYVLTLSYFRTYIYTYEIRDPRRLLYVYIRTRDLRLDSPQAMSSWWNTILHYGKDSHFLFSLMALWEGFTLPV